MASPDDRRYLESHEWHKVEGEHVLIGVSQFAVEELTDVTFLEIEKREGRIAKGETFGEVESVKATSELYCGVDGVVEAVNEELEDNPSLLNEDPYEKGWMIKVRPDDPAQLEGLMDASAYDQQNG